MSTDYVAEALIGVRIDPAVGAEWKRVKAFEHDYPDDWEVDPKTAKKLWTNRHELIPALDKFDLMIRMKRNYNSEITEIFIALRNTMTGSHQGGRTYQRSGTMLILEDLPEQKKALQEELQPLGLWKHSNFGLWAIQWAL